MTDYLPYLGDVLAGIASADSAQSRQTWNALIQDGAQVAWNQARPALATALPDQLGHADLIQPGWTLYEIELTLAERVQLARAPAASTATGGIPMQLRLGPNLLIAKSTTPTVFGSDFDPKFSVDFGVVVDFTVTVVPERMLLQVAVGSAHITGKDGTGDPHLDSQNATADIAKAIGSVVSPFFGGPDFVRMLESVIHGHEFAPVLNQALAPVNDMLGELAAEGMGAVVALFPDASVPPGLSTQSVSLGVPSAPEAAPLLVLATPVTGDGTVRGQLHWPKDEGEPQIGPPYAGAFALSASVDRGAAQGQFAQSTDVTHLTSWEYAGTDTEHVLRYALTGLPVDEPISVECHAASRVPWTGPAATKIRSVGPDGWSGHVTVREAVSIAGKFRGGQNVTHRAGDQVELNPQPIPPGREKSIAGALSGERRGSPLGSGVGTSEAAITGRVGKKFDLHDAERAIVPLSRTNPTATGVVESIDFIVALVDQPR